MHIYTSIKTLHLSQQNTTTAVEYVHWQKTYNWSSFLNSNAVRWNHVEKLVEMANMEVISGMHNSSQNNFLHSYTVQLNTEITNQYTHTDKKLRPTVCNLNAGNIT